MADAPFLFVVMPVREEKKIMESGRNENEIHLRPHHGLCLLNFRGVGYSDEFSTNMAAMQKRLFDNPQEKITITEGADDLCRRCPNRRGSACRSEHPPLFDSNVLRAADIAYGQTMTWQELSGRTDLLRRKRLEEMCPDCEWLDLCRRIVGGE